MFVHVYACAHVSVCLFHASLCTGTLVSADTGRSQRSVPDSILCCALCFQGRVSHRIWSFMLWTGPESLWNQHFINTGVRDMLYHTQHIFGCWRFELWSLHCVAGFLPTKPSSLPKMWVCRPEENRQLCMISKRENTWSDWDIQKPAHSICCIQKGLEGPMKGRMAQPEPLQLPKVHNKQLPRPVELGRGMLGKMTERPSNKRSECGGSRQLDWFLHLIFKISLYFHCCNADFAPNLHPPPPPSTLLWERVAIICIPFLQNSIQFAWKWGPTGVLWSSLCILSRPTLESLANPQWVWKLAIRGKYQYSFYLVSVRCAAIAGIENSRSDLLNSSNHQILGEGNQIFAKF